MTTTSSDKDLIRYPVKTREGTDGIVRPRIGNEEALKTLKLEPYKTVWGWDHGRPILNRLPEVSQTYQIAYERDQAYVFVERYASAVGPNTLQPGVSSGVVLVMEAGTITWQKGQAGVERIEIDTTQLDGGLGLQDGEYQIGYQLDFDFPSRPSPVPGYSRIRVTGELLDTAAVGFEVSGATKKYEGYLALSDGSVGRSWWPNSSGYAGEYEDGSWLVLDFQEAVPVNAFQVNADPNTTPGATLALYASTDGILWEIQSEVKPTDGGGWNIEFCDRTTYRYWRFFFYGGDASISAIYYDGEAYYPDERVTGPVTIATPYIDSLYEEIEGDYLLVATFTVSGGVISRLTDQRRTTDRRYEPVSDWLTTFGDEQLRCQFNNVVNYAERYLAPPTADYHLYEEMDDSLCTGPGEVTLGTPKIPSVILPDVLEIIQNAKVGEITKAHMLIDPGSETLEIDPPVGVALDAETILVPVGVAVDQIELVKDPEIESDLANKGYTYEILTSSWSLDNGLY